MFICLANTTNVRVFKKNATTCYIYLSVSFQIDESCLVYVCIFVFLLILAFYLIPYVESFNVSKVGWRLHSFANIFNNTYRKFVVPQFRLVRFTSHRLWNSIIQLTCTVKYFVDIVALSLYLGISYTIVNFQWNEQEIMV